MFYGKPRFVLNIGSLLSSWDNLNSFRTVFWALIRHIQYFFEREKELTGNPRNTQGKHSPRSRRTSLGFSARNPRAPENTDVNCSVKCPFHRGTGLSMFSREMRLALGGSTSYEI